MLLCSLPDNLFLNNSPPRMASFFWYSLHRPRNQCVPSICLSTSMGRGGDFVPLHTPPVADEARRKRGEGTSSHFMPAERQREQATIANLTERERDHWFEVSLHHQKKEVIRSAREMERKELFFLITPKNAETASPPRLAVSCTAVIYY